MLAADLFRCGVRGSEHAYGSASGITDDVESVELSDRGTLWGWTAVTAAPPGYSGAVPFGFGVVELTEGLRVITRITEGDPAKLEFGMPMRLVADVLHADDDGTDVITYAFTPEAA